jgi:hypothetical protein
MSASFHARRPAVASLIEPSSAARISAREVACACLGIGDWCLEAALIPLRRELRAL